MKVICKNKQDKNIYGKLRGLLFFSSTLVLVLLVVFSVFIILSQCGKRDSGVGQAIGSIKVEELAYTPEIEDIIAQVPPPQIINVKELTIQDIQKLKPIPAEDGGAFKARPGDLMIETENIRSIIQAPSREIGPFTYGGNLVDVDVKRGDEYFRDTLGEENLFVFLGHTLKPAKIGLFKNNVVVATGELDILDYINATGLLHIIKGIAPTFDLKFKIDEAKPIKVTKYFIFSSGRYIKIIDVLCNESDNEIPYFFFADLIDSGGSGEFFIPSSILKGYGYSAYQLFGLGLFKSSLLGFVSEKVDSSYGIYSLEENNLVLIISGVAALAYNVFEKDEINSLLGIMMGTSSKLITIQPRQCLLNQKYFIVGTGSASSLTDEVFRIKAQTQGIKIHEVTGRVVIEGENFIYSTARVAIFDKSGNFITTATTDKNGVFKVVLPEGSYKFVADTPYSPQHRDVDVQLPASGQIVISLPQPAKIYIEVFDVEQKINIPAKVSFLCDGLCPKPICIDPQKCQVMTTSFRDVVYDMLPPEVQHVEFLKDGKRTQILIPPGKYKVIVSRGMEYSRYEESITVGSGQEKSITAYLHRVADAGGWISADTHVHSVNSPDSPVDLKDRVITFAAEGVDLIISTDHDWLTDYEPAIAELGLKDFLVSLIGQEITTFSYGHFNTYPLRISPGEPQDGALDWSDKYDRPEKYGINSEERKNYRFLRALHPLEIFEQAHLMKPGAIKRNIVQVNHPRSGGMGYFDYVMVDTKLFTSWQDPCIHRIIPPLGQCGTAGDLKVSDTKLLPTLDILRDMNNPKRFDAIEIYNSYSEVTIVVNDWFTLLNHGIHITAVGCSDTHQKVSAISGIARTFVKISDDSLENFRNKTEIKNEFVENLLDGQVFVSNGPILEDIAICGLYGSQEVCTGMGRSQMKHITSNFRLKIKLKSVDWVDFDKMMVFINSRDVASKSKSKVYGFPTPAISKSVAPQLSEKIVDGRSFRYRIYEDNIQLPPQTQDFWVVVVVECSVERCGGGKNPMFPIISDKNVRPLLITNPIYIDVDGDGRFTPAGPEYAPSQRQAPIFKEKKIKQKSDSDEEALREALKNLMHKH